MVSEGRLDVVRSKLRVKIEGAIKPKKSREQRLERARNLLAKKRAHKAALMRKKRLKLAQAKLTETKKLVRSEMTKAKRLADLARKIEAKIEKTKETQSAAKSEMEVKKPNAGKNITDIEAEIGVHKTDEREKTK